MRGNIDALSPTRRRHPGADCIVPLESDCRAAGAQAGEFTRLGIGRHAAGAHSPAVADYVLGLIKDDGRHCWGMFGSCPLMGRTKALRGLRGFDERFRQARELDFAGRAPLGGARFISVDAPLVTRHLTPSADKAGRVTSSIAFYCSKSTNRYLRQKRAYVGAWC